MGASIILALILGASLVGLFSRRFLQWAVLRPYEIGQGRGYHGLLTSGFVHADLGHIAFNLITFISFAFRLEQAMGTGRFVALYLSGLLVSGIGTCIRHRDEPDYGSLGASGAILAVLFASIIYFPRQRLLILPIPVPIPGPLFAIAYLALSYYWSRQQRGRINHDAHLGGALTGIAFVALTEPQRIGAWLGAFGV